MTIGDIARILDALVLTAQDLDVRVEEAFGADMMSDVLAFVNEKTVLITGLTNPHVIRTAEIADIGCIVFARGKIPDEEMLNMAKSRDIAVLSTQKTLYTTCGLLYQNGLRGCEKRG
jgi:predicted transcriptional regulator